MYRKNFDLKKKCFLSTIYHIVYFFMEKLYFVLYFVRKKRYFTNFGFFLPKISNVSFNNLLYKDFISLKMQIPEGLKFDFIRSTIGRNYFRFFFRFFGFLNFFFSYFLTFFKQIQKISKNRLKSKLFSRNNSRYFLRFFSFISFEFDIVNVQKTFNFFFCNKISKNFNYKKKFLSK